MRAAATGAACTAAPAPASARPTHSRSRSPTTLASRPSGARAWTPDSSRPSLAARGRRCTYFFNRYDDLIVAVGRSMQDYSRTAPTTSPMLRRRASKRPVALRTRRGLEFRAAYTFAATEVLALDHAPGVAPAPFAVGDPLLRRPGTRPTWICSGAIARSPLSSTPAGARPCSTSSRTGRLGRHVQRAGLRGRRAGVAIRVARALDVLVRADNLLDRRYEAVFGYPAPRRSFTVGVRLAAGR